jgi:hypothetical protein
MSIVWSPAPAATSITRLPGPTPAMESMASVAVRSQARICGVWSFQPGAAFSHWFKVARLNVSGSTAGMALIAWLRSGCQAANDTGALRFPEAAGAHNGGRESA